MVMQDKQKLTKKLNTYSLLYLFFGTLILSMFEVPTMIINLTSFIACSVLYSTIILQYKLEFHKIHIPLTLLGVSCMILQLVNVFYHHKILSLIVTMSIYAYYLYSDKLMTGKINKSLVFFAIMICGSSFLGLFFKNKYMTALFLFVDALIYLKLSNKMFTSMANKRKEKLEQSGFTEEDAKKVPLIRRILFGKTGKMDWGLVTMLTGKDFSKKVKEH